MWLIRRFLLKLTQEQLVLSHKDKESLKGFSKDSRSLLYRYLTTLSYTCNSQHDRRAALYIRNKLMSDTRGEKNKIDEEIFLKAIPSDFVPNTLKNEAQ